jgi:hypothetical protein
MARELGGRGGEPAYPCFDWTGELLCAICGYLEDAGWAYDYTDTRRWLRSEELMAKYLASKAAASPPA